MIKESLIKEDESFGGIYYSFLIIAMIAISAMFSIFVSALGNVNGLNAKTWYILLSFSLSPFVLIFASLLFAWLRGENVIKCFGWQKCDKKYYLVALIAFVAMFFGLANVNSAFVDFLSKKFGYEASNITLPDFSVTNYLLVVLTICVLPAISEEIAMRGIVLRGIKSSNVILNAVLGGLLFSLFHMNPMQTIYQFAVGFVFSLIAIRSRSTIPTTLTHFLNNFAIITIEYFCPTLFADLGGWMLAITIPATICFALVTVWLTTCGSNNEEGSKKTLKSFFIYALAGIFICTFMWTMSFLG